MATTGTSAPAERALGSAAAENPSARGAAEGDKVRVAIVGGGIAGLAAAWELAKLGGYKVSVYEASWRLGGKGASGRDRDGRIIEHGLHVWLGFYENAFRLMRECYAEVESRRWGPDGEVRLAHATLADAFVPQPTIGVGLPPDAGNGDWRVWTGELPATADLPGTSLARGANPFTLGRYLERCLDLIRTLHTSVVAPADALDARPVKPAAAKALGQAIDHDVATPGSPAAVLAWLTSALRQGALTAAAVLGQTAAILEAAVARLGRLSEAGSAAVELVVAVLAQARRLLAELAGLDPELRLKTQVIDIVITIAVGLTSDRVLFTAEGFDAINGVDYRAWLRRHGASDDALASRFLTGIYDLAFAYRDGDRSQPSLAAGVALRGALRMFLSFRGAMFWRMRSGMGDCVFAPLYRVLKARGVEFHFQHRLERMDLATGDDGRVAVAALDFSRAGSAADVKGEPLDHFGGWPATPPAAVVGEVDVPVTRHAGTEFDAVIVAAGVADFVDLAARSNVAAAAGGTAVPAPTGDRGNFFAALPPAWAAMRKHAATVATQAGQVWLTRRLADLGWRRGAAIVTAFAPPFETVAEMTPTLASERAWRRAAGLAASPERVVRARLDVPADPPDAGGADTPAEPAAVAYVCGVLADAGLGTGDRASHDAAVRQRLDAFVERDVAPLWPVAFGGGHGEPPAGRRQAAPNSARDYLAGEVHAQANWQGSDRYTLSLPGTIEHRLSPLSADIANLALAGDWTSNGLDCGCIEAAVMSGMLAAHAITGGTPALADIIGYDHP